MSKLIGIPIAIFFGIIAIISAIGSGFLWLFCLALTLSLADVLGNAFFILTGNWKKCRFHSRYFFIARSKWDKPKPLTDYMYTRKS